MCDGSRRKGSCSVFSKVSSWVKSVLYLSLVSGNTCAVFWLATPKLSLSLLTRVDPLCCMPGVPAVAGYVRALMVRLCWVRRAEVPVEFEVELTKQGVVVSCFTRGVPILSVKEVLELLQQHVMESWPLRIRPALNCTAFN